MDTELQAATFSWGIRDVQSTVLSKPQSLLHSLEMHWYHPQDPEISALIFSLASQNEESAFLAYPFAIKEISEDSSNCAKHWSLMQLRFYGKSYLHSSWELELPPTSRIWVSTLFSLACWSTEHITANSFKFDLV